MWNGPLYRVLNSKLKLYFCLMFVLVIANNVTLIKCHMGLHCFSKYALKLNTRHLLPKQKRSITDNHSD